MIKVKHLLDAIEKDDGCRLWIEAIGLTRDLQEWCRVDHVLSYLGPPTPLSEWFEQHPDGWEYFRGNYHEFLGKSKYRSALQQLACAGLNENFTLLHQGDDPAHNAGTALYEFLSALSSFCPPEEKREE